jgi:hypothetical protein
LCIFQEPVDIALLQMRGPRRINERSKLYLKIQSTGSGKGYSPNKGRGKAICRHWLGNGEVANSFTSSPFPPLGKYLKVANACQKTGHIRVIGTTEKKISWYAIFSGRKLSRYHWRSSRFCTNYIHLCSSYCLTGIAVSSYVNIPSIHLLAGE